MGQAMSSETLSISGGDGYFYRAGLKMNPMVGHKKTVYKGVLLGSGPRQWEKIVGKAFTHLKGTKEMWRHEVNKANVAKQLAAKFVEDPLTKKCKIQVVIPGIAQMDKVSSGNKFLAGMSLDKDEWISVEEFLPGHILRYCPWCDDHVDDVRESELLQTFSHFTYKHTRGALVACDFQGTCSESNGVPRYIFTDSILHSTHNIYGVFDKGLYGITEFFKRHKCNRICSEWPKPNPLTPPPSFEQAIALNEHLTPPPTFENVVFPSAAVDPNNRQITQLYCHGRNGEFSTLGRRHTAGNSHGRRRHMTGEGRANGSLRDRSSPSRCDSASGRVHGDREHNAHPTERSVDPLDTNQRRGSNESALRNVRSDLQVINDRPPAYNLVVAEDDFRRRSASCGAFDMADQEILRLQSDETARRPISPQDSATEEAGCVLHVPQQTESADQTSDIGHQLLTEMQNIQSNEETLQLTRAPNSSLSLRRLGSQRNQCFEDEAFPECEPCAAVTINVSSPREFQTRQVPSAPPEENDENIT